MRKVVSVLTILGSAQLLFSQQPFVLLDSTPVRLRLARTITSADSRQGDTVDFEVLDDVLINDIAVIKRGSTAIASVTEAKRKGRMGKAGKLDIAIDHTRLANSEKVALRAVRESDGGSNAGKMTGAIVATSIVFFPAAPLFLLVKGKDITIPKGTEITAYVNGDIKLDPAKFGVSTSQNSTPLGKALTNADILKLREAGLSDELIINSVKSSLANYDLSPDQVIELKNSGLSETVINAMMTRK